MLDISVTVEGDKVVIENLDAHAARIPAAIDRALTRVGTGVFENAQYWLSGAGGASKDQRTDYVGFTKKSGDKVMFRSYEGAGAYPVPARTGFLRQLLDWLHPGEAKSGPAGSFTAGPFETVIFDSALYARVIREGTGSSRKYGPRDYLTDGLTRFDSGGAIKAIFEEEIEKETK
jgi:hypothetical protein